MNGYLSVLLATGVMILALPLSAFLVERLIAVLSLSLYSAVCFIFMCRQWHQGIQKYVSHPLVVTPLLLALLHGLYYAVHGSFSDVFLMRTLLALGVPMLIILLSPAPAGRFRAIDLVVFLLLFLPVETGFISLPLVSYQSVVAVDGVFLIYVLFGLYMYIGHRRVRAGFDLSVSARNVVETILLTALLIGLEYFAGTRLGVLAPHAPLHMNVRELIVLPIFYLLFGVLAEEFFFRGLIYNYLRQFLSRYWLIIPMLLSSLIFGSTHFNNGGLNMFYLATLAGFFYCLVYVRTGNLFCAIFMHTVTNLVWKLFF